MNSEVWMAVIQKSLLCDAEALLVRDAEALVRDTEALVRDAQALVPDAEALLSQALVRDAKALLCHALLCQTLVCDALLIKWFLKVRSLITSTEVSALATWQPATAKRGRLLHGSRIFV